MQRVDFARLCEEARPRVAAFMREFAAGNLQDERLRAACLHLLGRGKLIRPLALIATAKTFDPGIAEARYLHVAAALELIHTFTLIHDDLPELDGAQLRRGVPAVHVEFGDEFGLLAGDALHNLGFLALAQAPLLSAEERGRILSELTHAVNATIAGQAQELALSGGEAATAAIEEVARLKTGRLFAAALVCGALLARASGEQVEAVRAFGLFLGLAYQVKDDLLSATGETAAVGKSLERDVVLQRPTLARLQGVAAAEQRFAELNQLAREQLDALEQEQDAALLRGLLDSLMKREK